jgi:copper chaperone
MDRLTMKIDGMSCGHCVGSVTKALESLDGVDVEQVKIGEATVAYDPATTSASQIAQAVADEGYTAVPVDR